MKPTQYRQTANWFLRNALGLSLATNSDIDKLFVQLEDQGAEIVFPGEVPSWLEEVGVVGNMDGSFDIANEVGEVDRRAIATLWRKRVEE